MILPIYTYGQGVLKKEAEEIDNTYEGLPQLIQDMFETLKKSEGVGLAAPQVGVLRQIVVIDVGDEDAQPLVLINPKIIEADGEQTGPEGCLSVPGKAGQVTRPNHVKVAALNENMEPFEAEGTELLARAICHELDHLQGVMYVDKVEGQLYDVSEEEEEEAEEETEGAEQN